MSEITALCILLPLPSENNQNQFHRRSSFSVKTEEDYRRRRRKKGEAETAASMSLISLSLLNITGGSPVPVCYENGIVNSKGWLLGDKPLNYSVPLILLDISLIFLLSNATYFVLKRFGQSRFVAELLTGIILGPSMIGQSRAFREELFKDWARVILDTISITSVVMFIFTVGVKTDLTLLRKPGRRSLAIAAAGTILPFLLCLGMFYACRRYFPNDATQESLLYFLASRLSLSSFPVLATALDELQLLNSELGRIVMSASLVTDVTDWIVSAVASAVVMITRAGHSGSAVGIVGSLIFGILFVTCMVRPAVMWVSRRTPIGELLLEWQFLTLLLTVLVLSVATQVMGFNAILGPLLLGLAIPGGMPFGQTLTQRLEPVCMGLFLPIFNVLAGYRTDFNDLKNVSSWGLIEMVVVLCVIGKLIGAAAASRYFGMSTVDSISVGLMLNVKGIVEVAAFNTYAWGDIQIASVEHFSMLIISILVVTAIAMPMIKYLYDPKTHYVARKPRTLQYANAKPNSHLRMMICVHSDENVAPILDLWTITGVTPEFPVTLTILHLNEITGHNIPVLRPYKPSHHSAPTTPSDHIMKAFLYFEQKNMEPGAITLHPYVAIAPYATLFNDVCYLALQRNAHFLFLPFHKINDGTQQKVNYGHQSLNRNVFAYAPCTVVVFIDRNLAGATCANTNHLINRLVVYFLGGEDDREALALALRFCFNPNLQLTVVRFLLVSPGREETAVDKQSMDKEERLDEETMEGFRELCRSQERMQYVEKHVVDGEGTAAVIREMSEKFDLLLVGRRKGVDSELTKGLTEWCKECPELGILGDMLATSEFTEKVSLLVVQQQKGYKGDGRGKIESSKKRRAKKLAGVTVER